MAGMLLMNIVFIAVLLKMSTDPIPMKGIIHRLVHFKYLGIETIILGPIYKSPMIDFGYDVSNYTDIDQSFGDLTTFDRLVQKLHEKGIKLILDFIPNHTSDHHPWFIESRKGSRKNPYADFYVWHDGKVLTNGDRAPPNNWMSVFGGSAWTWNKLRGQYYYHQYLSEQPDLNWRNHRVQEEILKALEFWLDHGVDGFRMNAVDKLYEVEDLSLDEPRTGRTDILAIDHRQLHHIYVRNQPEIHHRIREWRKFFDMYEEEHNHSHIYLLTEMRDPTLTHSMEYYHSGADQPVNFNFMSIGKRTAGIKMYKLVQSWLGRMPVGKWPSWVLGNQDERRISNKRGEMFVDALNTLLLLLPGTPITYQGEEIGMRNIHPLFHKSEDIRGKIFGQHYFEKYSRDGSRGPMQWNSETNAGFTKGQDTWLPVHGDYRRRNVLQQTMNIANSSPTTTLELYRRLSQLRKQASFQRGGMRYSVVNKNIFSFVRYHEEDSPYLVAMNFGNSPSTDDYTWQLENDNITFEKGKIVLFHKEETLFAFDGLLIYLYKVHVDLSSLRLNPGEAFVMELLTR